MNSPNPQRLLSIVGAMTLTSLINGCTLFTPQPKGQIVVQAVSWTLVKKWAEPDAGVNTRSKVHQRAEVKIHQLERGDGLMVLLLARGARGGSPPRCCCEELIS